MTIAPGGSPDRDSKPSRPSSDTGNPTPLDALFIVFVSVALVVLVFSFAPVRGTRPFQNLPDWFVTAVSNVWGRFLVGAGAIGSIGLRKWLDRSPSPNYLVWISALTAGLLVAIAFSVLLVIPPRPVPLSGKITEPNDGQIVPRRKFICQGRVNGFQQGDHHFWLAVRVNGHIWPKERELQIRDDGSWESTLYEDGATDKFALSLISANDNAEKRITQWMEDGKRTGQYAELVNIEGTEELDRIIGLKLKTN